MFGANQIVGKKDFLRAEPGTLFVTSIFFTLQGEGPYAGRPAVFVRLAKCNLACSFCDTFFDAGDWLTFESILLKITLLLSDAKITTRPGLVITGGEPFLQPQLAAFLDGCVNEFSWVQIESNGTVWQSVSPLVTLVVSPKCLEQDRRPIRYLSPNSRILERADCLKFVMCAPVGLEPSPYADVPAWAHSWASQTGKPVYISPMNIYNDVPKASKAMRWVGAEANVIPDLDMRSTVDEVVSFWEPGLLDMAANEANHRHAARYCMAHNFRFNLQMHLYAGLA